MGWSPTTRSASGCRRSSTAWSGCPAPCSGYRRRAATCSASSPARWASSPCSSPRTCSCARPSRRARLGGADAARVRELLVKHGDRDSLGYFALRDDKSVIWSPTGKACVCYRVVSGVMLASGDPIGDPEAWPGVIGPFLDEAARHAWAPAVMGCSELGAEVWCREGGLTALELGDEAIVNVADFSLSGRSMRNVRQMVNRVAKHGYVAEVRRVADIPRRRNSTPSSGPRIPGAAARPSAASPWPSGGSARPATRTACWPPRRRTARSGPCCSWSRGARTACRST